MDDSATLIIENANSEDFFSGNEKLPNHVQEVRQVRETDFDVKPDIETGQSETIDFDDAVDAESEQAEIDDLDFESAAKLVNDIIDKCKTSPGKLRSREFNNAIRLIRSTDVEMWAEIRVRIKRDKPSGVLLGDIDKATSPPNDGDENGGDSIASELITLVMSQGELFFDDDADCSFFHGDISDLSTTLSLNSKSFMDWISYTYYMSTKGDNDTGKCASELSIKQAKFALSGIAKHEGEKERVFIRIADSSGGHYIFIGDDQLRAIEVLPTGWRILDRYPVKFWKPANMKALPLPQEGGDISRLWNYVNVIEHDRLLVLGWLLECYRAETPNPVLFLTGGQGCAKSSSQNRLRELVDNNAVNLRSAPKAVEDIFVGAGCNWLVSFENMSNLTAQMQDALCVLATGGGFAARQLYTNSEESVISVKRPVILNGISHVISAQDLTDRSIQVELQRIDYIEETAINAAWEIDAPLIMGGLMDLFVKTLAQLPKVKLDKPPRMADFTRLGEAMTQSLGHSHGYFTAIYSTNRAESVSTALESSPAATAIRDMVADYQGFSKVVFTGTMKDLLNHLEKYKHDALSWPRSPKGLGDILRRQEPALKMLGITLVKSKSENNSTLIKIVKDSGLAGHAGHGSETFYSENKKAEPNINGNTDSMDDDKESF